MKKKLLESTRIQIVSMSPWHDYGKKAYFSKGTTYLL